MAKYTLSRIDNESHNEVYVSGNVFEAVGNLVDDIKDTVEARRVVIREIIVDTMTFQIDLYDKLSKHFEKERLLAQRRKNSILHLFDLITFSNINKNI